MDVKDQLDLNSVENIKMPPHSLEAEESALGSMMLSKEAITSSIEILKTEDFYQMMEVFRFVCSADVSQSTKWKRKD